MTYTVRTRGAPGLVLAEYECPVHGRFEATEKGPPDEMPCPFVAIPRAEETKFEFEGRTYYGHDDVTCSLPSPWVISAVHGKVKIAEVQRGKSDERPPWALDTTPLAEGATMSEWRAIQDKKDRDWRRKKNREALK